MSMPQYFPIQLQLDVKEWHFWQATCISSNPINFINAHSLHFTSPVTMRIDKGEWIAADNYGQQKMEEKAERENMRPRHCLTKCSLEDNWTKIADLGIIFLRRSYLKHWYPIIASLYCWIYAIPFFYGPPCIRFIAQCSINTSTYAHFGN